MNRKTYKMSVQWFLILWILILISKGTINVSISHGTQKILKNYTKSKEKFKMLIAFCTSVRPEIDGKPVKYYHTTLEKIFKSLNTEGIKVAVGLCDRKEENNKIILDDIVGTFGKEILTGSLEVLSLPNTTDLLKHLDFVTTYPDSPKRIEMRSHVNLKYSYLMESAIGLSDYYLHIEDDTPPVPDLMKIINTHIDACRKVPWYYMKFSFLPGYIGILYKNDFLPTIIRMHRIFFTEQPCDLIFNSLAYNLFSYPQKRRNYYAGCPYLNHNIVNGFKHIGKLSNFNGI